MAHYTIRLTMTDSLTRQPIYPVWCWAVPLWDLQRQIAAAYAYGVKWHHSTESFHGLTVYRTI